MEKFYNSAFAKKFGLSLVLDSVFLGFTYLLMVLSGKVFQLKAMAVTNGMPIDQFQQLLSTSPEQAQLFADSLRSFVLTFIFLGLFVVILGILFYSLTRSFLWSKLLEKKFDFQKHWRWNLLALVLLIPLVIYLVIFYLIRFLINTVFTSVTLNGLLVFVDTIFNFGMIILFFVYTCFVFISFMEHRKAWHSLGHAFSLFRQNWKKIRFSLMLMLLLAVIFNLILNFLGTSGILQISGLNILNFSFIIIYLALLRTVIVRKIVV